MILTSNQKRHNMQCIVIWRNERRIKTFILCLMDHPVLLKPRLSILHCFIELCTLLILLQIIRSSRNSMKKRGKSLSHFVQPTAWHFKFNLFLCAISNPYFSNFVWPTLAIFESIKTFTGNRKTKKQSFLIPGNFYIKFHSFQFERIAFINWSDY